MRDRWSRSDAIPIRSLEVQWPVRAGLPRGDANVRVTHMTTGTLTTDRKTISINKASELVGVSRRTIYNWIASGKVEYIRTVGGSVRIFVDTLWRTPEHTTVPRHDGREVAAAGSHRTRTTLLQGTS